MASTISLATENYISFGFWIKITDVVSGPNSSLVFLRFGADNTKDYIEIKGIVDGDNNPTVTGTKVKHSSVSTPVIFEDYNFGTVRCN